ncbi:5'-3' exonuclease H3TH domain-containing protein [Priestia sp. YIM B13489]|uniref:5'-3' exonuclease n=1 Tax=Priestia sp. YIM B13489 TaxID=3366313 RepID=UPI00366BD4C7
MKIQKLLLIDGFNLLSRGYFATAYGKSEEQLIRSSKGVYTNALRIFFQKTFNLIAKHDITHLAVAWDVKRNETARKLKYDFYKSTRSELPEPLIQQYEICTEILSNIGIQQVSIPSYEADDVIGTLSKMWCSSSYGECLIYSNDKDLLQLLSENTSQIIASKKNGETVYSLRHFEDEYGITSRQWIDVKALLGDTSDNIPGCPGVGEKSAIPLVQQYGSLEKIYEQIEELDKKFNRYKKKLIAGKDSAYISKELSAIVCDIAELHEFPFTKLLLNISKETLFKELNELEIRIKY